MDTSLTANQIRQMFMDFFMEKYEVTSAESIYLLQWDRMVRSYVVTNMLHIALR